MANFITGIRLVCSMALLCCVPFSPAFYALYLIAGATDALDGAVAIQEGRFIRTGKA